MLLRAHRTSRDRYLSVAEFHAFMKHHPGGSYVATHRHADSRICLCFAFAAEVAGLISKRTVNCNRLRALAIGRQRFFQGFRIGMPAAETKSLFPHCEHIALDKGALRIQLLREKQVLKRAKALADRRGIKNISWKRGELEKLPIDDESVGVALLSQALHHAGDPKRAVAEAVRILRPGGSLLVLELREHDQAWVRDRVGDRWLGFKDEDLERLLSDAGLSDVSVRTGARLAGDPFTVLIAGGNKRSQLATTTHD